MESSKDHISIRQRIFKVKRIGEKHYFVLFGKPVKTLSHRSSYLRLFDLQYKMQHDQELHNQEIAGLRQEIKRQGARFEKKYNTLRESLSQNKLQFRKYVLYNGKRYINKERVTYEIEKFGSSVGVNQQEPRSPQIIVSLTSYPDRMYDIHYCLYSLLNQTLKPDKVLLWLSKEQFPRGEEDLPQKVLAFKKNGLSIGWYHDIKSYKKLIPALLEYPNDMIVTADDDIYYPNDWLESLVNVYDGSLDIFCHRAHRIKMDGEQIAPYRKWISCVQGEDASILYFPTTGGGVLYPPHALYKDATDESIFYALAPYADDIWFWAMALLAGRKIHIISKEPDEQGVITRDFSFINPVRDMGIGDDEKTLYHVNIVRNDTQLASVMEAYPDIQAQLIAENCPPVSIVMLIDEDESDIKQRIDSLSEQSLQNVELICMNADDADITSIACAARGDYISFLEKNHEIRRSAYETMYRIACINNIDIIKAGYDEESPDEYREDLYDRIIDPDKAADVFSQIKNSLTLYKRTLLTENNISLDEALSHAKRIYLMNQKFRY